MRNHRPARSSQLFPFRRRHSHRRIQFDLNITEKSPYLQRGAVANLDARRAMRPCATHRPERRFGSDVSACSLTPSAFAVFHSEDPKMPIGDTP
jgi:hypothetical protein